MNELLNSLPQIFLFGSVLYFYIITIVLLIVLFISDNYEAGFHAFAAFIIFLVLTYFWGTFEPLSYLTWINVGIYLVTGFLYSLIRTYFYGRKSLKYNGYRSDAEEKEVYENYKNQIEGRKSHLKSNVFRWWFLFPISIIDWIFSDLVKDVYDLIYKKLYKLYNSILDYGIDKAER